MTSEAKGPTAPQAHAVCNAREAKQCWLARLVDAGIGTADRGWVSARFASSDRQSGSLVRVPTSVGLVLASESISGSAETFIARWCEFQRVSAWCWPQKVFLAPQRLLLRGACARMCVRMGWSELSRRAPMGHVCAVVAACMCAWGGASSLVAPEKRSNERRCLVTSEAKGPTAPQAHVVCNAREAKQ